MSLLQDETEIKIAQNQFEERLKQYCNEQIIAKIGHRPYTRVGRVINWSDAHKMWFYSEKECKAEIPRYWTVFGLLNKRPEPNSLLGIVCEINSPLIGINRRVQGFFSKNEMNKISLFHRGKLEGGKKKVSKKIFFEKYKGTITSVDNKKVIAFGNIESPQFFESIKNFVYEVDRIKKSI